MNKAMSQTMSKAMSFSIPKLDVENDTIFCVVFDVAIIVVFFNGVQNKISPYETLCCPVSDECLKDDFRSWDVIQIA